MGAELSARRTAAAAVLSDYRAELASAPLTRPPGREWMLRLASVLGDLLAALDEPDATPVRSAGSRVDDRASGPFETERQVHELAAVRAVYDAFDADPGAGKMAPHNRELLGEALSAAGVELGAYDARIAEWLAGWEPQTVAVIAGWVSRALGPFDDTRRLGAIRGVLARFDWEHDDRQLALEAIERISEGGQP